MIDVAEKKKKIIDFLSLKGPLLPVRIAKEIEMSPVFASAILSELLGERKVKLSNLRVGSSPLYLLTGQEKMLEEHTDNLKPIEKEAYLLLKKKGVLVDEEQNPMIRVALRAIKDFAVPNEEQGKLIWKYAFEDEVKKEPEKKEEKIENLDKLQEEKIEKVEEKKEESGFLESTSEEVGEKDIEDKIKEETVKKDIKKEEVFLKKVEEIFDLASDSEFLDEIKDYLKLRGIKIIKEIEVSKKEVVAHILVKSDLGELTMVLIARNKKTVNEEELKQILQRAMHEHMLCLFILRKEPSKKLRSLIENNHLIRLEVMEE